MRQKPSERQSHSEKLIKDIRRATRKHYSAEDKIRIVLDGLRGESSIAELILRRGWRTLIHHAVTAHPTAESGDGRAA